MKITLIIVLNLLFLCSAQASATQDFVEDLQSKNLYQYYRNSDLEGYAQDFGGIIHETPLGVFAPHTVENLQAFLPIVSAHNLKTICRGKGNSAFGQAQIRQGVVIDLSALRISIHYSDDRSGVKVPSYKTWLDVIEFVKSAYMTVPVTLDNLDLTTGGTLSFGAIGGTSYRWGSGADNVSGLLVVTMDGTLHECSSSKNSKLFEAVLCGIGWFGIIIEATLPLVPAKKMTTIYNLTYNNAHKFIEEQKTLYDLELFEHLKGSVQKNTDGKWEYVIEAATYYDNEEPLEVSKILEKISPDKKDIRTLPYFEFINVVTNFVTALRNERKLNVPHPWYNVLMPERAIEEHLALALDTPHLTGADPIIVYPLNSDKFKRPLFIKPDSPTFYLLGVLHNTSFLATPDYPFQDVLNRNKALYHIAKAKGGCRYPVDAIPFTAEDWRAHYGEKWESVCLLKEEYDPQKLLEPKFNREI